MLVIKLDASTWETVLDFYDALLPQIEAPFWHGKNVNALVDSMAYGQINGIEAPYKIWIQGTEGLHPDVRQEIDWMVQDVSTAVGSVGKITFQIDPYSCLVRRAPAEGLHELQPRECPLLALNGCLWP